MANCVHCLWDRLWNLLQCESLWHSLRTLAPHLGSGQIQYDVGIMEVPSVSGPLTLYCSHCSCIPPPCTAAMLVSAVPPQPRDHPGLPHSQAGNETRPSVIDKIICSRHCQLIITSPEYLWVSRVFSSSSEPEACLGHHHPGPALNLKGMPQIFVVGQCYQVVQDHINLQTHPMRTPVVLQAPLLPHLSQVGEVVAILPFPPPGPEECRNWTPLMDELTAPEVQKNWVRPLPLYEELHLQFLPTSFELVEPLHTS